MLSELLRPHSMTRPVDRKIATIYETEPGQFIAECHVMRCVPGAW
jgi:hypothetical protein